MLQIATAMIGKPKVLIIDGAFDGLDKQNIEIVCRMLEIACKNWRSAVLVGVSLIPNELKSISSKILTFNEIDFSLIPI